MIQRPLPKVDEKVNCQRFTYQYLNEKCSFMGNSIVVIQLFQQTFSKFKVQNRKIFTQIQASMGWTMISRFTWLRIKLIYNTNVLLTTTYMTVSLVNYMQCFSDMYGFHVYFKAISYFQFRKIIAHDYRRRHKISQFLWKNIHTFLCTISAPARKYCSTEV